MAEEVMFETGTTNNAYVVSHSNTIFKKVC